MDIDKEKADLRTLSIYAQELLENIDGKPLSKIRGRETYLLALFVSSIAQVQGILVLLDGKQYRVSLNLARTLYEIWVYVRFIYCTRSWVYVRFLILVAEREKKKKLQFLESEGHVQSEEVEKQTKRVESFIKYMERTYPEWPHLIPNVITGGTPATRKDLNLLQCSQIIDFYNVKFSRVGKNYFPIANYHQTVYPYLSGGAHADPIFLGRHFKKSDQGTHINIDSSMDEDEAARLCATASGWFYELIRTVKYAILRDRPPKYPEHINILLQEKGIIP